MKNVDKASNIENLYFYTLDLLESIHICQWLYFAKVVFKIFLKVWSFQHTQDFQNVVKTCRARFLTLIGSMRGLESTLENPSNDSLMPALGIAFGWEGQLKN